MTVYADVLIFINTIINYAVIMTAEKLLKLDIRLYRLLLAAFVGALFSLTIFIDIRVPLYLFIIKAVSSAAVSFIAFGFRSRTEYLKALGLTVTVSLFYSGFFILFYQLFRPPDMLIVNDIVYLDVNPLLMIGLTAVIYVLLLLINKLFSERIKATIVRLSFDIRGKEYSCIAKIDTGCNLTEPFSAAPVIIADRTVFSIEDDEHKRIIPYSTVDNSSYLYAVKADAVTIDKRKISKTVYIASVDKLNNNYHAVINSDIIR